MDIEVAETAFGYFVPKHLLEFREDSALHAYFRQIIQTNYKRGITKLEPGVCENCFSSLSWNGRPRMKPGPKLTRKIKKLQMKSEDRKLGKCQTHLVERYLRSSNYLTVRCHVCQHVNKRCVASSETKRADKNKSFFSAEVVRKPSSVNAAEGKKKKKKKRKKQKEVDANCGLIIPASFKCQAAATLPEMSTVTTASATQTSSSSPASSALPRTSTQSDISTPLSKREASYRRGSQPISRHAVISQRQNLTSGQTKKNSTPSQKVAKKQLKHKQLKELLLQNQHGNKRTSLTDFLSSL